MCFLSLSLVLPTCLSLYAHCWRNTRSDVHVQITFMKNFVCIADDETIRVLLLWLLLSCTGRFCALCASISPNRFTFWSLLERKMNQNISRGSVGFLSNINYKSTSRLLELVISSPHIDSFFLHILVIRVGSATFLPIAWSTKFLYKTFTPFRYMCSIRPEVLLVWMSKKNITIVALLLPL